MLNIWKARNLDPFSEMKAQGFISESFDDLGFGDVPQAILRLLYSRGYTDKEKIKSLLHVNPQHLSDPFAITDMKKATERLVKAWQAQEMICVYADFDMDGTSGLAMMLDALKQLGFKNVISRQPKRMSDGYGLHAHLVEEVAQLGVKLIVSVDVGITAIEAVEKANSLGLDVIITDHHQVVEKMPNALAVVNPNRDDDHSGLGYLCGTGVAFYLLRALKRMMINKELIQEKDLHLQSLLDCFVIATLTDMVPLVGDNRILVRLGLKQLELTERAGLKALILNLGMEGRPLSSQDVAIRFAPKLNALSRMEDELMPIDIFLASDFNEARVMIEEVLRSNANRVQMQENGDQEASALLEGWKSKDFVFLISKKFHRGVVGLIATRIANQKKLPCFIGSVDPQGVVTGSARLPNGSLGSLVEALESAQAFFHRFGGHEAAAGFEFDQSHSDKIIQCLESYYQQPRTPRQTFERHFDIDLKISEVDPHLLNWMDRVGPFGTGFETPLFRIKGITLVDVFKLKGGHLRLKFNDSNRFKIDGVLFSPTAEILENLPAKGTQVVVIAEVQWNYFGGSKGIQLLVKDIFTYDLLMESSYGQAEI